MKCVKLIPQVQSGRLSCALEGDKVVVRQGKHLIKEIDLLALQSFLQKKNYRRKRVSGEGDWVYLYVICDMWVLSVCSLSVCYRYSVTWTSWKCCVCTLLDASSARRG